MHRSPSIISLVIVAVLACAPMAFAQLPNTLSTQGLLNDANGDPLADGAYDLTFKLYTTATGGFPLWTETQTLTTENGIFDASLGAVTPLSLSFEEAYWLGIAVGNEPEMADRIALTRAAYAFTTDNVAPDTIDDDDLQDDTVVRSLNELQDAVEIIGGANVTVATDTLNNEITISAIAGGGDCVTLDEAYDCDTPGAGRTITVDSNSVKLDGTTANQHKILEVIGGPTAGIAAEVTQASNSVALAASISNAANAVDVITGVHSGLGSGVYGRTDAAPTTPAPRSGVRGESAGFNGVSGRSNDSAGVFGESNTGNGVWGKSADKNGVEGNTAESGTWAVGVPANLVGGVLGRSAPGVDSADNFAVIGNARDYGGIGVFGLGGIEKGHGVMGMSGTALPDRSNAAVRGATYEGVFPPAHWELDDKTSKLEVGVLGQSDNRVAVWGESKSKWAVVGNTGGPKGLGDLPGEGVHPGEPSGVFGMTDTAGRNGVHGWAPTEPENDAGVVAEGDGFDGSGDPRAAALEIRNGAIRVSGTARPADSVSLPPVAVPIFSCDCDGPCGEPHRHIIGYHSDLPIDNPLAKPDSIILVSVDGLLPVGQQATVQVLRRDPGMFRVRYAVFGDLGNCNPSSTSLTLHYQIINPFPMGAQ